MSEQAQANVPNTPQPGATPAPDPQAKAAGMDDTSAALLKEVMQQKEKIRAYEAAEAKRQADADTAEQAKLLEQGKYKEALEKMQNDLATANTQRKIADVKAAAMAAGIDPRYAKLIDSSGIEYGTDGALTGMETAVEKLIAEYPEAKNAAAAFQPVPGVTTPGKVGGNTAISSYDDYLKLDQAQKTDFVKKHPAQYRALAEKAKLQGR